MNVNELLDTIEDTLEDHPIQYSGDDSRERRFSDTYDR